ncbi:MAG TPA: hypothetical protein VJS68_04595 [Thermoplasmata archaeon]|nr:hypothetical protein [Thermoplasmata archaeon]
MVAYEGQGVLPTSREKVWTLLQAHLQDDRIGQIHGLIRGQRTLSRSGEDTVVERTIDARGKLLTSQWKVTYRPPEFSRWEVLQSQGPWATGSYLENTYTSVPEGTNIRSRGDLRITVLPFFIPQKAAMNRVFATIDSEDEAFARKL